MESLNTKNFQTSVSICTHTRVYSNFFKTYEELYLRDDNVDPVLKRLGDGLPGSPAHDDRILSHIKDYHIKTNRDPTPSLIQHKLVQRC
jgi:hypothetical protein